jgi:hypothetical protein
VRSGRLSCTGAGEGEEGGEEGKGEEKEEGGEEEGTGRFFGLGGRRGGGTWLSSGSDALLGFVWSGSGSEPVETLGRVLDFADSGGKFFTAVSIVLFTTET